MPSKRACRSLVAWLAAVLPRCGAPWVAPRLRTTTVRPRATSRGAGTNEGVAVDLDAIVASAGFQVAPRRGEPVEVAVIPPLSLDLSAPGPELDAAALLAFERRGHCCTRSLFAAAEVEKMRAPLDAVSASEAAAAETHAAAMNDLHGGLRAPFLQTFNPHRRHAAARTIATSPRLASVAAQLLGVDAVRLYQTCLFRKRAGDEHTNWHSDLHTSPLDTNGFVTVWMPLHAVPASEEGGTALQYATGSHRDLALPMWYGQADADGRYDVEDHGAYAAGDASWHHGWCLHSASENSLAEDRLAFTASYFADGARVIEESGLEFVNDEDHPSYDAWLPDLAPGDLADHDLLPVVPTGR